MSMELVELFGIPLSKQINNRQPIPTGILVLDNLLGGGIINRGINIISGAPGVGKTQLLLKIADNAYKLGYDILYLDTELAIHESRFNFVNRDLINFIIPSALTLEELDEKIATLNNILVKQTKPLLFIIDSLSAMSTSKKIEQSVEKETALGLEAKLLTNILYKLIKMVSTYNLTILATAHLKQAIQMPMISNAYSINFKGYRIPGGQALQYVSSQLLILTHKGKKELKDLTLQFIEVYVLKNRLAASGLEATLVYSPDLGYSDLITSLKYLEDNNLISVNQGRYKLPFTDKSMFLKDIILEYKNNKEFANKLNQFISDHIKTRIEERITSNIEDKLVENEDDINIDIDLNNNEDIIEL